MSFTDPIEKMAYQQGAADAASMMDSVGQAPDGGMGAGEPQLPGAEDGPASLDQIAQILIAAVQSGEIDEQTAEQVMAALAQGEGGGAPGAPGGGDPNAGAVPPEAAEEVKAASALFKELVTDKAAA